MAAEKDLIVAIELGSSAIRGIAGKKNADGSIQVLDIAQEPAMGCIRKGIVYNIDKTVQSIRHIIQKLQDSQHVHICKVYAGLGGLSLRTVKNSVSRQLESKEIISEELVDNLLDTNLNVVYPEKEILDVIPQEYHIGTQYAIDPVGILSNHIEGRFLNVVARTTLKENMQKCFSAAGLEVIDTFISPLALADNVLTDTEKRSGCALIDFGADTTTVSIYKNNLLRHLAVIPLGGSNITQDICSLQIEDDEAEELKLQFGTAYTEPQDNENSRELPIRNERSIKESLLQEIVEARMEEIIANVWEHINSSGHRDKLLAGIIVTGGAANMKNLDKAFTRRTGFDKLKFAKILQTSLQTAHPEKISKNGSLNTLLSLLTKGDQDCTGEDPDIQKAELDTVLDMQTAETTVTAGTATTAGHTTEGTSTPAEEAAKKKEKKKKGWGFFSRIGKAVDDLTKEIVQE